MLTRVKNGLGRLAAGLAAFGLAGCATADAPAGAAATTSAASNAGVARPALWQVSDEDTTIYLFGTIHTLPAGTQWRSAALDRAIGSSDELVTEIVLDNPAAAAQAMAQVGFGQNLPPLLQRVPEDKRAALRAAIEASGVPAAAFDRMDTWAAALTITSLSFMRAGLDPQLGVEQVLTQNFTERQRPRRGLETIEQQLGFFDTMPESEQREFLVGVVEENADVRAEFDQMLAAWRSGDTDAIARTFDDEAQLSPRLRELLLTRRNAGWADWIQQRMAQPGTVFIAVGAGHLAGEDSVRELLKRRGLRVRRVQ